MPDPIPGAVVAYFPDAGLLERLRAMRREVTPLLVVDNTIDPPRQREVEAAARTADAEYLAMPRNEGVAGALNTAFTRFQAAGHRHAIAFDQDSLPSTGFAAALLEFARTRHCAVIGANWHDLAHPDRPSRHLQALPCLPLLFRRRTVPADGLDRVTFAITSGSLFDLQVWADLGGFDPSFPLDYADIDFCLRAHRASLRVGIAADARLAHRRGSKQPVRLLGHIWWPAQLPAERRARLLKQQRRLLRRHGLRFPHWAAYEIVHRLKLAFDAYLIHRAERLGSSTSP